MMKEFTDGIRTIFPKSKDKDIIGAVISVAYADGTFDQEAILTDAEEDFSMHLIADLLSRSTNAILDCYSSLPSAIEKLGRIVA